MWIRACIKGKTAMTISYVITLRLVFTSDGVGVVIRSVELYDLVKTAFWFFWFRLRLRRLRSSKNWVVEVASRSGRTKPITKHGNVHYDWFIFPLLLPSSTIWFSLDRKRRSHKRSLKKVETFWFFRLLFCCAYDFLRLRFLIFTGSA